MSFPMQGPARQTVSFRDQLDNQELESMQATGTIIIDDRRRRPLYFDGRFLAARDLTREQNYFLTRQADLGQASGTGVVTGLLVAPGDTATSLQIMAGHGITGSGELVVVPDSFTVDLADVGRIQPLDASFGLLHLPQDPLRNRSGVFIVGLRAVEYTANPIASYPTSLSGPRTVSDGDIIEAAAVTLIPYTIDPVRNDTDMSRARAAHTIFLDAATGGLPINVLPLAMIAVDRDVVQWIDPYMVRRDAAAAHGSLLSLGFAPRALREAYLMQYQQHLSDVLASRAATNRGRRFAASEHFLALPAAGVLPTEAIDPSDFTQSFFPPEVDVTLSIVPDDEIPAILEESLTLPPIDLTLSGDDLRSTSVLVLMPVSRARFPLLASSLTSISRPVLAAAPGLVARRLPLDALRGLMLPRMAMPVLNTQSVTDATWAQALQATPLLWYVRRRNLEYRADVAGLGTTASVDDRTQESSLLTRLTDLGLKDRFAALGSTATAAGNAEMVALLSSTKFTADPLLCNAVITDLEQVRPLDRAAVMGVADRYTDPQLGDGLKVLEQTNNALTTNSTVLASVSQSGAVPALDQVGRLLPADDLAPFTGQLVQTASSGSPPVVATLINDKLKGLTA